MGHNMELYCTQPTVRRGGVEKQIKLQSDMWHADCRAGTDKSLPTHPSIKSMQNFDWELATVQWGEGAMLFVRKGRGRVCWAIGWSTA